MTNENIVTDKREIFLMQLDNDLGKLWVEGIISSYASNDINLFAREQMIDSKEKNFFTKKEVDKIKKDVEKETLLFWNQMIEIKLKQLQKQIIGLFTSEFRCIDCKITLSKSDISTHNLNHTIRELHHIIDKQEVNNLFDKIKDDINVS